jgi:autophagy-related protein 101
MNCQIYQLPELETATSGTREALQAIIHTILFIRSPGPVAPHDVHCESFQMTYTRIATDNDNPLPSNAYSSSQSSRGPSSSSSSSHQTRYYNYHQQMTYHKSDLDRKVDDSIETFLRTLTPIGPELMAGNLAVSFFERRSKNKLFGLVNQEEKVVWEQWILRVVVNNTPRPMGEDEASVIERQRIQVCPRLSTSCHNNVFQQ